MKLYVQASKQNLDATVARVPGLGRKDIWRFSRRILQDSYPDTLREPQPTPIEDIYEYLMVEAGFDVGPSSDLVADEGLTRPSNDNGRPECVLRPDVYEGLHAGVPRARFTTAHECGHGLMHAKYLMHCLRSGRAPALRRRSQLPAYQDPEWQANEFAGSLLMPTTAMLAVLERYGADPYAIADTFTVSPSAAEMRIRNMRRAGLISQS